MPQTDTQRTAIIHGVYLVTDEGENLPERVSAALDGGVAVVQFRRKSGTPAERLALGRELRSLCRERHVPFIVNDEVELARELDADGVHLGQDDGTVADARQHLPPGKLVGISTHDLAEATRAEAEGADYIGFGAMYPTRSKEVSFLPGPERLAEVRKAVRLPMVAIGGITAVNAGPVIDAGADAVAVISAVLADRDPATAAAELRLLFNRRLPEPRGTVLTVAGSDSGGGAGIQADLKTVTLLGAYGASVITALTAQNTLGVTGIHPVPAPFVTTQLETVLSDIPVDVVKTGMLPDASVVAAVAAALARGPKRPLVLDPVMIAKGGASLAGNDAVTAMREHLIPRAYLLTPNIPEAETLTGLTITDEEGMRRAAAALRSMGARNVVLKGGHLEEGEAVDLLFDGATFTRFTALRIATRNTHGTGCTFASAVAAFLARGEHLPAAVRRAKEFVTAAIREARPLGAGHGPVNHWRGARAVTDINQ